MRSRATHNALLLAAVQDDSPDPEIRHIHREAYAVEAEAFALVLTSPLFLDRGALNDLWNLAFAVILASA